VYKILITNCDKTPVGGAAQMHKMLELYELSDKTHLLVDEPKEANFILICDAEFDKYAYKIRKNLLIKKYPNKCFILSNFDKPFYYARGIFTSAEKSGNLANRFRSCSYTAYFDPYHNPYVLEHKPNEVLQSKNYLFSFMGRNSHPVRKAIFDLSFIRKDIMVKDTSELFSLWGGNTNFNQQQLYYNLLLNSKFALCPRGYGTNSIRLFEAMKLGIAPIIISDDFILPNGPNWEEFSIIIKEKDVKDLEQIMMGYEKRYTVMGALARENFEKYFSDNVYFNYVIENIRCIYDEQLIPEVFFHRYNDIIIFGLKIKMFCLKLKNKIYRNQI
jgi:hypothetical protein